MAPSSCCTRVPSRSAAGRSCSRATSSGRALTAYHGAYPLRRGMPREQLRSRLGIQPGVFPAVLKALAGERRLVEKDGEVSAPDHQIAGVAESGGPAARLLELLAAQPFAPPSLAEATRSAGASVEMVRALAQSGDLVRLSDDVAFTRAAYEKAVEVVKELITSEGSVSVAQMRDRLGASRRPMLALLEHLDSANVTRRVGDARVLR